MPSTATNRAVAIRVLALSVAMWPAKAAPPRVLQEPVFGLNIDAASPALKELPEPVRKLCSEISDTEYLTARMWVFGTATDDQTTYYIVGGYFQRRQPERDKAKYRIDAYGGLFRINAGKCVGIGAAREVFDVRPLDEVPQPVLQNLADNVGMTLTQALGGKDALRAAFAKKHIEPASLPQELREAIR